MPMVSVWKIKVIGQGQGQGQGKGHWDGVESYN